MSTEELETAGIDIEDFVLTEETESPEEQEESEVLVTSMNG